MSLIRDHAESCMHGCTRQSSNRKSKSMQFFQKKRHYQGLNVVTLLSVALLFASQGTYKSDRINRYRLGAIAAQKGLPEAVSKAVQKERQNRLDSAHGAS